jgi:hypothetical protein
MSKIHALVAACVNFNQNTGQRFMSHEVNLRVNAKQFASVARLASNEPLDSVRIGTIDTDRYQQTLLAC